MKALSMKEPYAWLVLQRAYEEDPRKPLKPVENRSWPLPLNFTLPQRVWIHASLTMYDVQLKEILDLITATQWLRQKIALHAIYSLWDTYKSRREMLKKFRYFGHILGSVVITGEMRGIVGKPVITRGTVHAIETPWFFGPYGYWLEYPELLKEPIPFKGRLGFFEVGELNVS